MDAQYATRKQQLLAECQVAPEIFDQVMPRLETFMAPFVRTFCRQEPAQHAHTYVYGLLSDLKRKNVESIAYRFGQDRLPLQRFIGWAAWEDAPLRQELTRQVAEQLGQADGVLVFDPSAFAKSGAESVGVARQWCGRLGKVDNCQVALYLGYVSGGAIRWWTRGCICPKSGRKTRRAWTSGRAPRPPRLPLAAPVGVGDAERHGAELPHRWIAGDDEMGRPYWFRRRLASWVSVICWRFQATH